MKYTDKQLEEVIKECIGRESCRTCPYNETDNRDSVCAYFRLYNSVPSDFITKIPNVKSFKRLIIKDKLENL